MNFCWWNLFNVYYLFIFFQEPYHLSSDSWLDSDIFGNCGVRFLYVHIYYLFLSCVCWRMHDLTHWLIDWFFCSAVIGTIDALQRLHSSAEEPSLPDIFTKQSLNATLASALSSSPLPWSDLQVKVIRYVCCAYIFLWLYSYFVYDLHVCGFLLLVQVYQYWFLGSRPILSKIVVVGWCIFFFLSHKNKCGIHSLN